MIKYTRLFITFLLAVTVLQARSQSTATTSSPYSRYGLGNLSDQLLPQNIGMGGIATATSSIGGFNNINIINPASYSKIGLTVIDAGLSSNVLTLTQNNLNGNGTIQGRNTNTMLSHIALALPITRRSAIAFGLVPYSQMGYNYRQSKTNLESGSPADTNQVNYIYTGDGGLSKAFLGYGFGIGKHLSVGGNFSYIFGNLKQQQSTEIPNLYGVLNSRVEQSNHISGINFDYGVQYSIDFSATHHLVLGYSASANSKLNTQNAYIVSQYYNDINGNQNIPLDSLVNNQTSNAKLQLPQINHFGILFQKDNNFMIGADYTMGKWSDLSIAGTNAGLQDSKLLNIGGQITPNANSLSSYLALIDYRLGFIYEDTYLNLNNTNIKRIAGTIGLGIPLPHDRASTAFYKINFSAEIGRRGTLENGLVRENYVNFHLGFLLNDRWFQRYKFE